MSGTLAWALVALGLAVVVVRRRSMAVGLVTAQALLLTGVATAVAQSGDDVAAALALAVRGVALAAQLEKFKKVPTVSGRVTFSKNLHAVTGRAYRVIRIQNNVPKVVGSVTAKVGPKI